MWIGQVHGPLENVSVLNDLCEYWCEHRPCTKYHLSASWRVQIQTVFTCRHVSFSCTCTVLHLHHYKAVFSTSSRFSNQLIVGLACEQCRCLCIENWIGFPLPDLIWSCHTYEVPAILVVLFRRLLHLQPVCTSTASWFFPTSCMFRDFRDGILSIQTAYTPDRFDYEHQKKTW